MNEHVNQSELEREYEKVGPLWVTLNGRVHDAVETCTKILFLITALADRVALDRMHPLDRVLFDRIKARVPGARPCDLMRLLRPEDQMGVGE